MMPPNTACEAVVKTAFSNLALIFLLASCAREPAGDTALRATVVGTWTTADVTLPDQARVSGVTTMFQPSGSWLSRYTVSRAGNSRQQVTSGTWQIQKGCLIEIQTNVDGVADTKSQPGSNQILHLDSHEMILSNWYAPSRTFFRKE